KDKKEVVYGGFKMYFVNQKQIEETLEYMDKLLNELDKYNFDSLIEKLALQRMTHLTIEAIIDVGNMMIDGFIMRDPGSYEDIIDILVDERVLPEPEVNNYKEIISLRKMLVKEYLHVDDTHLIDSVMKNKEILNNFSKHIRTYVQEETDVAHAFSNEK